MEKEVSPLPELILIDKPKGISSFTVIRKLRRELGPLKFGYAGTLDPLATGLLLVGVGKGTKKLTDLIGLDKEYVTTIMLGEARMTDDMAGAVTASIDYRHDLDNEKIKTALEGLLGEQHLPVSVYSAIKQAGVPLYKKAYKREEGKEVKVEIPVRKMSFYEIELLEVWKGNFEGKPRLFITLRTKVSSGTYIRSLAVALGNKLGYPAVVFELRRTKVGQYRIEDAVRLKDES